MDIFDLFKKIENQGATGPVTALVVGLGNVGTPYVNTRHNAGFIALDAVAKAYGATVDKLKYHAMVGECKIGEHRVLLMKPETLMNNSGIAVGEAANFYKIPPERVIVLVDDISFAPGSLRIRRKGSAGGHNGLKSIIEHLGSEDFPRVRLGVGQKPRPDYDLADWVLGKLPKSDLDALTKTAECIPEAVRLILDGKLDDASTKFSKTTNSAN